MKKLLLTSCLALGLVSGLSAGTLIPDGEIGGAADGAVKINFNDFSLGQATQWAGPALNDVQVSFAGGALTGGRVVELASPNVHAAPYVSGLNGLGFGPAEPDGPTATRYLSTGVGSITFEFTAKQNYFGLLWGSVDDYNSLSFYNDDVLIVTVTGADVWAAANGDQGQNGTFYVNLYADAGTEYNKVVATSSNFAFEIDNVAYGSLSVPDSGATVALLGLSLACLVFFRRKAA